MSIITPHITGREPAVGTGRASPALAAWRRAEALYQQGIEWLARKNLAESIIVLREALAEYPDHDHARHLLEMVEETQRRQIEAYERRRFEEWRRRHHDPADRCRGDPRYAGGPAGACCVAHQS
jgi:hypothetical protein